MSRALLILDSDHARQLAGRWVGKAPTGTRLEFKAPKRTLDQNAKMWCVLTEIATQLPWHGLRLTAEDWKLIFLSGLNREMRIVPNLDGTGFVNLGTRSSDLSKSEMSDLLELMHAFAAQHGVRLHDDAEAA